MPKQGSRVEVNTFVKGLITEASPLNFPANASSDEENFELNRDGTRARRVGIDFEEGHSFIPTDTLSSYIEDTGVNTFKWFSVEGNSDNEFLVVQVGNKLSFFDMAVEPLSTSGILGSLILPFPDSIRYSFATVNGKLVVAAGQPTVAIVSYAESTNTFSLLSESIKVRDQWGVEVVGGSIESDPSYQPTTSIPAHRYNLQNQSWGIPRTAKLIVATPVPGFMGTVSYKYVESFPQRDPVGTYFSDLGIYPSNSEVVWTGLQFQPVINVDNKDQLPYERMFTNLYKERFGGTAVAAKGYFIIDLLNRGISRMEAFAVNYSKHQELELPTVILPSDITSGGASVVCEFAGRVFFAGFSGSVSGGDKRSPILNNYVLFSQLVKSNADIPKCYQDGDPTSREDSDILETDGGFIRISGAKNIIAMRNIGTNLVVLADNGVWSVSGGSNYGFSATNYKVDKISSYGCLSESSVVVEGSQLLFWAEDGIYLVNKNQFGDLVVNSITASTIQSLYDEIPLLSKKDVRGEYDLFNKKIRWIYRVGEMFTAEAVTKELVLDTMLNAFYHNRLFNPNTLNLEVYGMFPSLPFSRSTEFQQSQVDLDNVVVGVSDPVGISADVYFSSTQSMRYLVLHKTVTGDLSFTFAAYNNTSFRDWQKIDSIGVDAAAYLLTGTLTANDSAITKQVPYMTIHMLRTEEGVDSDGVPLKQSSCLMRSQWDWADSVLSKKFGRTVQVYKYRKPLFVTGPLDTYDNGFETVNTKNKLRGRGKAIAIHFQTEPYKDCKLLGWSLTLNGNGVT